MPGHRALFKCRDIPKEEAALETNKEWLGGDGLRAFAATEPSEQPAARQDQTGKASASDGTGGRIDDSAGNCCCVGRVNCKATGVHSGGKEEGEIIGIQVGSADISTSLET